MRGMSDKDKDTPDSANTLKKTEKSDIAKREESVQAFWEREDIFNKSLQAPKERDGYKGEFIFYDGPPFATGMPHYGHLLQSAVKDAVPRYQSMRGYSVPRQWGWDCHGLPIENIVEKNLGVKSKKEIVELGVEKFNDTCREQIFTFAEYWAKFIPRFGRWADMKNPYRTMDTSYMESEWWAFKTLYEKGLVYEDYRIMHVCPRCETTLSQSEVTEGYATVKDLAVTVKFKLKPDQKIGDFIIDDNTYVLAWTTTPWTLPGNVALAVGGDIEYGFFELKKRNQKKETLIMSADIKQRLYSAPDKDPMKIALHAVYAPKAGNTEVDNAYSTTRAYKKGSELEGLKYEPLFDFYSNDKSLKNSENGWKIYASEFVTADAGTGVVHIAPAFGVDDMALAKEKELPFIQHVGMDGVFRKEVTGFAGESVAFRYDDSVKKNRILDVKITNFLEEKENLFVLDKNFVHEYPLCWRCDTPLLNYATSSWFVAVEKIKSELLETAKYINWTPKHFKEGRWGQWLAGARDWSISRQRFWANTIPVWRCDACKKDVVVGSVSELKEKSGVEVTDLHKDVVDEVVFTCECGGTHKRVPDVLDTWFDSGSAPYAVEHYMGEGSFKIPGQFVGEAQDQVSKWFYYQHVLSVALFGVRAFNKVVSTGIVLASDGRKMSKRLKNYPDPMEMIDKYGADSVRYYLLSSPIMRAENLSFDEVSVAEISRKILGRLVNVYEFYAMYVDSTYEHIDTNTVHILDRWIIARLNETIKQVTEGMEAYELDRASRPLGDFVDDLSTWYLRRSRDRFKGEDAADRNAAIATLAYALREFSKVSAPFMPFISEWLWQNLKKDVDVESVHLASWSEVVELDENEKVIVSQMLAARSVVTLALQKRNEAGLKVRQPLSMLEVSETLMLECEYRNELLSVIAEEVNVKEVVVSGNMVGDICLYTTLTPELISEGHIRDLIRAVQDVRKRADLKTGEKVALVVAGATSEIEDAIVFHSVEICRIASLSGISFPTELEGGESVMFGEVAVTLKIVV